MQLTDANGSARRDELFERLRREVVGLEVQYTLATGERTRRIYLDSTASTLRLKVVQEVLDKFQPYYSNTHSLLHFGAKLSTREYQWAHDMVLEFVRANPEIYTAFFVGSGTTGGMNRVACTLREKRPARDVVITTIMEHHSNDLPHRKHFREVVHIPAAMAAHSLGCVNLRRLEEALREHHDKVNYVAITGVSNVTGIINPVHDVAEMAHRYGALIVVDAAQMTAHVPIQMSGHDNPARDLDVLVFSGHKIYAPGSPGVVVTRQELFAGLEPQEVGGGMVETVYLNRYTLSQKFPDREEAGTPNICGAIGLAAALYALNQIGMDYIAEEECRLIAYAIAKLSTVDDLIIYGETDCTQCQRTGAISFNLKNMDHGLVAAALNDYFNISVRNECFCAHPYVREMVTMSLAEEAERLSDEALEQLAELHRGMVRASFGIYSTEKDVDALVAALKHITANKDFYRAQYLRLPNGDYEHKTFKFDHTKIFSIRGEVDAWLQAQCVQPRV
ncbi:MAG: aminotransferase class V-fold PLP-dependent enzyme [candidate division KSB1 bacterium]|nr:aminotransferase class V-fold PLP-dependent enzyme [candidate division KSB1 bacterium]MDZ7274053.1 aminotransferase class V-fold PLP-dependent enzyme [candidate division KSB1 bacterium]MDZ7286425.1 aminotransferase class V-fold PLP-dependent enzyme [candidate division KSB1 bacterium]MDZ7296653.1 aminotransferase class V-fold PLP-dependent enzyme [candidate division KSB1 bacterium]MDZ7307270.1 aminotransferase class V-fold PLP-dependent enzyme [candidate division KSB1 bacterium]